MPTVKYARSGAVHVAYMVVGVGSPDIVVTPGAFSHLEDSWGWDFWREPLVALSQAARVIVYDKRGTGMSDRDARFSCDERMDDIRAVMDAAGSESAHLIGLSEGGPLSIQFAATYPARTRSLVLFGTYPTIISRGDYRAGRSLSLSEWVHLVDEWLEAFSDGNGDWHKQFLLLAMPSLAESPEMLVRMAMQMRSHTSPGAARALWEMWYELDVRQILPVIRVPTRVFHRREDRIAPIAAGRYLADHIPGATLVELPGADHLRLPYPEILDWIAQVEQGALRDDYRDRRLATILFTDMVDSTPRAAKMGDSAWRALLDRHDSMAGGIVARNSGQVIKTTGDGLLAVFDVPGKAIRCGAEISAGALALGLPIRTGIHSGEIERRGSDIAGIGVVIASRVSAMAVAGEILVTNTVKELCAGSGFTFEERGEHTLKGIPDPWHIFAATV